MFDLAWSEIALIVVVALVVIGPKDLPDAVRGAAKGIGKLRRMAGEFQGHLDEVVREAKLEDVRDQIRDIRNFDVRGEIERAVDKDGTLRETLRDDPFRAQPPTPSADAAPATPAGEPATAGAAPGEQVSGTDMLGGRQPGAGAVGSDATMAGPVSDPAAPAPESPSTAAPTAAPPAAAHAAIDGGRVPPAAPAPPHPGQPEPRTQNA